MHPLSRNHRFARPLIVLIVLLFAPLAYCDKIVDLNGSTPYTSIQAAINDAAPGETITVLPGRYVENINFLGKALTLTSTDPDDPAVVAATIIDGSQPADPRKASTVTFENAESPNTLLTGFTITGGTGTVLDYQPLPSWLHLWLGFDDKYFGDAPWGIALDPSSGKMYWTDTNFPAIRRANLDGTHTETLVTTGLKAPEGIAIDPVHQKIYWADSGAKRIQRADLDGAAVETVIDGGSPYALALNLSIEKLYWTDSYSYQIKRANLDGTVVEDFPADKYGASAIAFDVPQGKIYWTNIKYEASVSRANLDGSQREAVIHPYDLPMGIALHPAAGKMYWITQASFVEPGQSKIWSADLDGTNVQMLVSTLGHPEGIALDPLAAKMYWTDKATRRIQRANLDGTQVETVYLATPALGGAIFCTNGAAPAITRNIVKGNAAAMGAGLGSVLGALPSVTNNRFTENTSRSFGAAVFIEYLPDGPALSPGTPLISANLITANTGATAVALAAPQDSSPVITHNTVTENNASGLLISGSMPFRATLAPYLPLFPTISDNTFAGNAGILGMSGAAIACGNSAAADISRNTLVSNSAKGDGGAISQLPAFPLSPLHVSTNAILFNSAGDGAGLYSARGGDFLIGNTFAHNRAKHDGGAIYAASEAFAVANNLTGETLLDNFILDNIAAHDGGGLCLQGNLPTNSQGHILVGNIMLRNQARIGGGVGSASENTVYDPGIKVISANLIARNTADTSGGVFIGAFRLPALLNGNTIVDNISGTPGAVTGLDYACLLDTSTGNELTNNILYANGLDITPGCDDTHQPSYCDIGDAAYAGTNLSVDPGFVDPVNNDYHLRPDSPLIDAGDPDYLVHEIDPSGVRDNPPFWPAFTETDLDGRPRILNGGLADRVDIGAYEFDPSAARPSPDPMDFAYATVVPVAGELKIALTAKPAHVPADESATVEYLFESPTGAKKGPASGWQSSPTFIAAGLDPGHWYTYRVKARNAARPDQETHWSPIIARFLTAPGDLDRDADVDGLDFATFANCYNGSDRSPLSACASPFADLDDDHDVDGFDFLTFANCYNGSDRTPLCP